jgi:hypothetical protein
MKKLNVAVLLCFAIIFQSVGWSQGITAGISSGMNLSDIRGQDIGGKWCHKPGPVQGLFLGYSFNKILGIQTGIDLTTIYYDHKVPYRSYLIFDDFRDIAYPYYYQADEMMDFRFLQVPLLLTLSFPSVIHFELRAGLFYSHILNYNAGNYSWTGSDILRKNDFGFIYSSGVSFPLNDKFKAILNAGYQTGKKKFLKDFEYRHGSTEFTMGIAYTGFLKNKKSSTLKSESDSASKIYPVMFIGGMNYSWNRGSKGYSGILEPMFGFSFKFPLGKGTFFQTGFSFERKGYSLKDSSSSFYRYKSEKNQMYDVDTKVQTDYAIIPALLSFSIGKSDLFFLNTGPWLGLRLNSRTVGVAYNDYQSGTNYQLIKTEVYDDIGKLIKSYDIGWIIAGGASVPIFKNYKVDMSLQYSKSFINVFDNPGLHSITDDFLIRNGTISFLLGFNIPSSGFNKTRQ